MASRADLVEAVYRRVEGLTKRQAQALVDAIFLALRQALVRTGRVEIRRFGTFTVKRRKARSGRNPQTGATLSIPPTRTIRFQPAPRLRAGVVEEPAGGLRGVRSGRRLLGGWTAPSGRKKESPHLDYPAGASRGGDSFDVGGDGGSQPSAPVRARAAQYNVVQIFYATDRKPTGKSAPSRCFGGDRGTALSYGTCEVTLPLDRRLGSLPSPSLLRLELRADPKRHVILRKVIAQPRSTFFEALRTCAGTSARNEALVFIHGFNVTFAAAALRTAQIAYDLQFEGAPILYSWPSRGRLSLRAYARDGTNAQWSAPHLTEFLGELAAESGASHIHLIAHSMGNRVLVEALRDVVAGLATEARPLFHEVVLTAPDIDAETFRDLARRIHRGAQRLTLYASENDRALQASKAFHGYPRAGDAGDGMVVVPPMESIDASAVDTDLVGHFYYGNNKSVLSDVFYLLREGLPPDHRFGLQERTGRGGRFWVLVP